MAEGSTSKRVIILGAGITGLSAGIRFLGSGCDVSILEKAGHPGGLAKTEVRGNYRLDIGPHHLFSQNETVLKEITDLFERDELISISRDAKIYFYDRFLNYPLTAKSVLFHIGLKHAFFASMSYIWLAFRKVFFRNSSKDNFQDWARDNFGHYLYNIFFKPYTEQFWGIPCKELSVDCIPQVSKMSFGKTLKMIFLKRFEKESLSVAERETSLTLFYPVKGIGEIAKKLTDVFLSKGGTIELNCTVSEIISDEGETLTLHYQNGTVKTQDKAAHVISTIPISSLVQILKPAPPDVILQSAYSLGYLSTIVLYIVIHDRDVLDCAYLYIVDRPYNRVSNINRFHRQLSPEGENVLALEITCHFNDDTWESSDDELFEKCIAHLESDGIIRRDEVKQFFTIRAKNTYPFYRLGYGKHQMKIFKHFEKTPITFVGRTGAFKYMDIDQCMEDTADLVKRFKTEGVI